MAMTKEIKASWGIPFSKEQRELANKLIGHLNDSQIALLDGYFNGDREAKKKLEELIQQGLRSAGGSLAVDSKSDPAQWSLKVLETFAKNNTVPEYGRNKPFFAPILSRKQLNGEGSTKETHHIELSLEGSGLTYEPGDSCGVFGHNTEKIVEGVLRKLKLDPNSFVEIEKGLVSLREALTHHLELSNLLPDVLRKYNKLAGNSDLEAIITDKEKVKAYIDGRDVLDLLIDFPHEISAEELASVLKKMRPRLYSIASSESKHSGQVHLTVGAVRYNAHGRDKEGTCSTYLADRIFDSSKVPVFIQKNKSFRVPADKSEPIIMVGAGTGIAPFRAFVEERSVQNATGTNFMIFGNPHGATDYLYGDEWKQYEADGLVEVITAFSRDQAEKVYVQNRIVEHSARIYNLLQQNASIYVCGSRDNLGESVRNCFAQVLVKEAGLSEADAKAEVLKMKKAKRYHEDVY